MSTPYTPPQPKEILRPSKTSIYFKKKGVKKVKSKSNTYTKTDGNGNVLRYSNTHRFIEIVEDRHYAQNIDKINEINAL